MTEKTDLREQNEKVVEIEMVISMKVKSVKTRILEEVGFLLPTKKLLSPREKVEIMEQFLMMPASQIVTLQIWPTFWFPVEFLHNWEYTTKRCEFLGFYLYFCHA